jgi:archaellin
LKSRSRKGLTGISALIIFIAVVLASIITATLIFSASDRLTSKALDRHKKAETSLSASIDVMSVVGSDGSNGDIEDFEIMLKIAPTSEPIHFNFTAITASTSFWNQEMEYNGTGTTAVGTSHYFVEYLVESDDHIIDYLTKGDIVKIRFHTDTPLQGLRRVKMRFIPMNGFTTIIEFTTPFVIKEAKLNLYPLAI